MTASSAPHEGSPRWWPAALAAITVVALVARVAGVGSDLWIDELATLATIEERGLAGLLTGYTGANQHTLNSVLIWGSIALFGEHEWSVRLPAVAFGVLSVPALYWLARVARFPVRWSLLGALLLALSYHHVWFSQNARGYASYLFLSVVSTAAIVALQQGGRRPLVVVYALSSALNFVALLPSLFVYAAQVLVVGPALLRQRGEDRTSRRNVLLALALAAVAALAIYLPLIRGMFAVLGETAPAQVTAYRMLSLEFLEVVVAGLAPGVPTILLWLAVVPAACGVWGMVRLWRQAPQVTGILLGAHLLFAVAVVALGWPIYPRLLFLLLVPGLLAIMAVLHGVEELAAGWNPRWRTGAAVTAASLALVGSVALLRPAYALPKQPYRAALAEAAALAGPEGIIVGVGVADRGVMYYGKRGAAGNSSQVLGSRDVRYVSAVLLDAGSRPVIALTTLNHALAAESPELWELLERAFVRVGTIPGSVRGAGLTIWTTSPGPVGDERSTGSH